MSPRLDAGRIRWGRADLLLALRELVTERGATITLTVARHRSARYGQWWTLEWTEPSGYDRDRKELIYSVDGSDVSVLLRRAAELLAQQDAVWDTLGAEPDQEETP